MRLPANNSLPGGGKQRLAAANSEIVIIGGGASGLAAACVCAARGKRVTILEAQPRVGRKLLATGNGRCNLLNTQPLYFGGAAFARRVLEHCGVGEVLAFFDGLGLVTRQEEGRVYPSSNQAAAVLDVLRLPLEKSPQAEVQTDSAAVDIAPVAAGWAIQTSQGQVWQAPKVIVAAGGMAAPKLGGGPSGYRLLEKLGHRIIAPWAALTPLETDPAPIAGLGGLRVQAVCTLTEGKTPVCAAQGEVLFSDYGVSGVCAMQLARDAAQLLNRGLQPALHLDFSPLLGLAQEQYARLLPAPPRQNLARTRQWLARRRQLLPPDRLFAGAMPRLLAEKFYRAAAFIQTNDDALAALLCDYPLQVTGVRGFEWAQVTAGGVDTSQVDSATMASLLHPGLYMTGEVLDVDGDCGGHNLLFAWASGILAARDACTG